MNTLACRTWKNLAQTLIRLCVFALLSCITAALHAQHMQLQLFVQNEIAVAGTRNPDFGTAQVGSGWAQINPEDKSAGRFGISASENIQVLVALDLPERLVLDHENSLPLRMQAAWTNSPGSKTGEVRLFNRQRAGFPLHSGGRLRENLTGNNQLQAFVFLFGKVFIGEVVPGVYKGEIGVRIEYE